MILADVRDYVRLRTLVSLADIMHRFDTDAETARNLLRVWIRKGRIHRRTATTSCGSSCNDCDSAVTELYLWGQAPPDADEYQAAGCPRQ